MNKKPLLAAGAAAVLALAAPLIVSFEGWRPRAYLDPIGIPTACAGHTQGVRLGQVYSDAECRQMLEADLRIALADVDRCTPGLPTKARAAMVSFVFNVGGRAYCASTLAHKANAGDLAGACRELSRWTYAGGRELAGLVRRRAAERALCEESLTAAVGKSAYARPKPAPNLAFVNPPKKSAKESPYVLARTAAVSNRDRSYRPARRAQPVRVGRLVDSRPRRPAGRR